MIRNQVRVIVAILFIGAGSVAYFAASYVATPKFIVKNESDVNVEVTAYWKQQSKNLGSILAGGEQMFELNDEAAMEFRVAYPDGQVITNSPAIYFTSGTTVIAVVTESAIKVNAEF